MPREIDVENLYGIQNGGERSPEINEKVQDYKESSSDADEQQLVFFLCACSPFSFLTYFLPTETPWL